MDSEFADNDDDNDGLGEFADAAADETVAPEFAVKDSIIFVIDARASMCAPGPGGSPSPFAQSLQCVLACMKDRILGGERDLVGVMLFGTEQTKVPNGQGFPHIYLLQELEEPSAASMRAISLVAAGAGVTADVKLDTKLDPAAASSSDAASAFGHLSGASAESIDLGNVLWVTSMLFNHSASKNTRRRVYILTNDDNPCASSPDARKRALTRSRDLQDANVWMEPFFFAPPPPATFDLGPASFWRELVGTVRKNYKPPKTGGLGKRVYDPTASTEPQHTTSTEPQHTTSSAGGGGAATGGGAASGGVEAGVGASMPEDTTDGWLYTCLTESGGGGATSLLERVRRKAHRKRVMWSSELTLGEGCALSFSMVGIIRPTPKPTAKKLEARSNEELISQTTLMCAVHGHPLQKEDVFKAYQYGGKWVYFDTPELSTFGSEEGLGANGLHLLGFKSASKLKLHHNLGANKFLEPTERVPGSLAAMTALVHSMHAKGKIAIARMTKGKQAQPRLVALLPQLLELEDASPAPAPTQGGSAADASAAAGARVRLPCGLHLIPLPYAEDIRSVPKPTSLGPEAFTAEELSTARDLVRALTLPPERNPVGTVTNPASATHFGYLEVLALNVPGSEAPPVTDTTLPDLEWIERSQPQADAFREIFSLHDVDVSGGDAKRQRTGAAKVEKAATPTSLAEWIAFHMQGSLSSLTIPILKEFCKGRGLAVGGKKDDLLARVAAFLEEEIKREAALGAEADKQ